MKNQAGRVAAVPNHQMDRADRMETELTKWLGGFEPTGTPIALRFRTFADLREDAARPLPRFPWLRSALSTTSSLGSVVAGAGLLVLVAFIGATAQPGAAVAGSMGSGVAGSGLGLGSDISVDYTWGPDPFSLLMLMVWSCVASCTVVIPLVRRLVGRIAFGKSAASPREPLPFRRSWRSVTPIAWILGAIAIGLIAWSFREFLTARLDTSWFVMSADALITGTTVLLLPVAVAWRYQLRDRSARLLLIGIIASISNLLYEWLLYVLGIMPSYSQLMHELMIAVWALVAIITAVAPAAGIAGRAGTVRRPPFGLAALVIGATFMYAMVSLFIYPTTFGDPRYLLEDLFGYLSSWVTQAGWAAIVWVGIAAWRRGRGSWGWKLVLASGILHFLALAPTFIWWILQVLDPSSFGFSILGGWGFVTVSGGAGPTATIDPALRWQMITSDGCQIALLVALLIGLRPPATKLAEPTLEEADAEADAGTPATKPSGTAPEPSV